MLDNVFKLYAAVQAKDWGNAAKYLGLVIQQLGEWYAGKFPTPAPNDTNGGIHVYAATAGGLATVKAGLVAELNNVPRAVAGANVDPATIMAIINLVIQVIDWWQARQK